MYLVRYALCDRMGDTRIISTAVRLCVACGARTTSIPSQRLCAVDREKSQSFGFCRVGMYAEGWVCLMMKIMRSSHLCRADIQRVSCLLQDYSMEEHRQMHEELHN